jgi:predicted nucleotidyltransferase
MRVEVGTMIGSTQNLVAQLKALKAEITARYRVQEIGVFGSVARGQEGEGSDVDVLVEFKESADLFDLVGLGQFLKSELARKVDVVSKSALRPEMREAILSEVLPL